MKYEITTQSSLSSGAMLVVRFPEEELDEKALYTIQADQPPFLIPFTYRSIDGFAECTYHIGSRSKLQYRYGNRTAKEYVEFWDRVLQPILDCDDWFLKPMSFVLDTSYLYVDRDGREVSYLYIPSVEDSSGVDSLKEMAMELSQKITTNDAALENLVLRAFIRDFHPKEFLQTLHESSRSPVKVTPSPAPVAAEPRYVPPREPRQEEIQVAKGPAIEPLPQRNDGDIKIDLGGKKQKQKEKKNQAKEPRNGLFGGLFGSGNKKTPKDTDKKKKSGGSKNQGQSGEIVMGAAVGNYAVGYVPNEKYRGDVVPAHVLADEEGEDGGTVIVDETYFHLVSSERLPKEILVNIEPGQSFTIGRFDVTVGKKQSDFEFDKNTKAVSRHHAAVERQMDGSYVIVDLASSAGTYLNGERMTPNLAYPLVRGCRVSFGTHGADYVWEG